MQLKACSSPTRHAYTRVRTHAGFREHLQVRPWPRGGGQWRLQSMGRPAHWQPAGPFLMQMTPGSLRRDWGPAPPERTGWGAGRCRPPRGAHPAHAHTQLRGWGLHPASAISTRAAPSSRAWQPRVIGVRLGRARVKEPGRAAPSPHPWPPGVPPQAAAVPSPSALADNGRFTADVAAGPQPASGREVASSPGPGFQPQVRPGAAHVSRPGLRAHSHPLTHTAESGDDASPGQGLALRVGCWEGSCCTPPSLVTQRALCSAVPRAPPFLPGPSQTCPSSTARLGYVREWVPSQMRSPPPGRFHWQRVHEIGGSARGGGEIYRDLNDGGGGTHFEEEPPDRQLQRPSESKLGRRQARKSQLAVPGTWGALGSTAEGAQTLARTPAAATRGSRLSEKGDSRHPEKRKQWGGLIQALCPSSPGQPHAHLLPPDPAHFQEERKLGEWGGAQAWGGGRPCAPAEEPCQAELGTTGAKGGCPAPRSKLGVRMKSSGRQTLTGTGNKGVERWRLPSREVQRRKETQDRDQRGRPACTRSPSLGDSQWTSSKGARCQLSGGAAPAQRRPAHTQAAAAGGGSQPSPGTTPTVDPSHPSPRLQGLTTGGSTQPRDIGFSTQNALPPVPSP